jgi:hypothetical protein
MAFEVNPAPWVLYVLGDCHPGAFGINVGLKPASRCCSASVARKGGGESSAPPDEVPGDAAVGGARWRRNVCVPDLLAVLGI